MKRPASKPAKQRSLFPPAPRDIERKPSRPNRRGHLLWISNFVELTDREQIELASIVGEAVANA